MGLALILVLVGIVVIAIVMLLGPQVSNALSRICTQ
jgi:Flp pilus assembly pilin Flp